LGQRATEIRSLGAEIAAIAVTSVFAQQAFAKSLGVDFPLLSDWNRHVSGAYGVQYDVWRGHEGLAKRSLFVIDRDGIIRWRFTDIPEKGCAIKSRPNPQELFDQAAQLAA
jgi:peroxiredoxin